jgi:hypothetical protein
MYPPQESINMCILGKEVNTDRLIDLLAERATYLSDKINLRSCLKPLAALRAAVTSRHNTPFLYDHSIALGRGYTTAHGGAVNGRRYLQRPMLKICAVTSSGIQCQHWTPGGNQ